jgi:hypothetical protein
VLDIPMDRRTWPPPPLARKLGVVVDVKVRALSELWSGL